LSASHTGCELFVTQRFTYSSTTDAKQNSDLRTFNAEYAAYREHSVSSWARLCHGHAAEILIRRVFVSRWAARPITEITHRDVKNS
jgi:hypothetical protein